MGRRFILHYDEIPPCDFIRCCCCRTRVAFVNDYVPDVSDLRTRGFINNMFNVEVPEDKRYHRVGAGGTLAETYCVECRNLLGWKLIAVPQPCRYYREGRFYMKLDKLIYWNNVTLFDYLFGGDNEQAPSDQDGSADEEQNHDQNGGVHEENADQDGDTNEQVPSVQDLGTNEQNVDQDGDPNELNEQNANLDGDANEQDLGANEQNADQDEGANEHEQNADQDEGANEQDVDITEGMGNIDLNANI